MRSDHTITRLSVTAIKGLSLHHPESIDLTMHGAAGDRQFYLVDEDGTIQSCTANPGLYDLSAAYEQESRRLVVTRGDEVLIAGIAEAAAAVDTDMWGLRTIVGSTLVDPAWSDFFSDLVGERVHLLQAGEPAFDVHPVTLLGTSSVNELARRAGLPGVDSRRFRMLIEFAGGEPHIEDTWDGQLLDVGDAVLRAGGPVKRCAAVTRNPYSGVVDLQTLRLIMGYRGRQQSELGLGANFGTYGTVLEPGTISVGDSLTVGGAPGRA